MNRKPVTPSRQFVDSLLDCIRSETCWQPRDSQSVLSNRFQTTCTDPSQHAEALFFRPETDAKIVLTIPTQWRGKGAKLVLDNIFDNGLRTTGDSFSHQLSEAHQSIAISHQTPYTEPVSDPAVICQAFVPLEYDLVTLEETLSALDKMAKESQNLHAAIEHVLITYLST